MLDLTFFAIQVNLTPVSVQLPVCKVQSDWQDLDPIPLKAVLRFV